MWYSSASLIFAIVIGMHSLRGVLLMAISFHSEKLSENIALSFREPMDNCDSSNNQNSVRLVQMGLHIVREDFVKSADVQFITLEDNEIFNFSVDAFRSVPNLSCLNIRKNKIINLPTLNHDNLRKLNLANSKIMYTRETIKKWNISLPHLTHLDLSNNGVSELPPPEIFRSSFPSLTHFYFSGNSFESNIFDYLPLSTEHLYLERNTDYYLYVTTLPPRIITLFLDGSSIGAYQNVQLSSLKTLSMRKCKNIEKVMYKINAKNLVNLDLSSNDLNYLEPYMFNNIRSLQRLSLEDNGLSSFPVLNELRLLTDLSLNFNKITNITVQSIGNFKKLRRLHLRSNRISLIEKDAFSKLYFLEKLDLSENKLTTLPFEWMLPLQKLSHLDLRSNLFTTIDDMSVNIYTNSMEHLYLGKNNFTRIEMSSLKQINTNVTVHVF